MRHFLRLIACFWNISVKSFLTYRTTAALTLFFGILIFSAEVVTGLVIFSVQETIASYRLYDYLLLISIADLIGNFYYLFFVAAHYMLGEAIILGDLDHTLTKPVNSLFYYSIQRMDVVQLLTIGIELIWVVYLYSHYDAIQVMGVLGLIIGITLGIICLYCMNQMAVNVSFWFDKASILMETSEYAYDDLGKRPLKIYPKWLIVVLRYIIPFGLISNGMWHMPIEGLSLRPLLMLGAWDILGLTVVWFMWKQGLKRYVSAN